MAFYNTRTPAGLSGGLDDDARGLLSALEQVTDPSDWQIGQAHTLRLRASAPGGKQRAEALMDRWNAKRDADREAVQKAGNEGKPADEPRFLR